MRKRKTYLRPKRRTSLGPFFRRCPHPRSRCRPVVVPIGVFLVPICGLPRRSCCSPLACRPSSSVVVVPDPSRRRDLCRPIVVPPSSSGSHLAGAGGCRSCRCHCHCHCHPLLLLLLSPLLSWCLGPLHLHCSPFPPHEQLLVVAVGGAVRALHRHSYPPCEQRLAAVVGVCCQWCYLVNLKIKQNKIIS
jgi:hypothetical protein